MKEVGEGPQGHPIVNHEARLLSQAGEPRAIGGMSLTVVPIL